MKYLGLLVAAAALAITAGAATAQDKKQLVIVVKGLDNAFFEAINQGCQKWNGENPDSEYECFYTGPASTSDEAGEAQIVADMLELPLGDETFDGVYTVLTLEHVADHLAQRAGEVVATVARERFTRGRREARFAAEGAVTLRADCCHRLFRLTLAIPALYAFCITRDTPADQVMP